MFIYSSILWRIYMTKNQVLETEKTKRTKKNKKQNRDEQEQKQK